MLSDDRANREKAAATGIKCMSGNKIAKKSKKLTGQQQKIDDDYIWLQCLLVREYVGAIKDVPELLDMLSTPKNNAEEQDKVVYEEV